MEKYLGIVKKETQSASGINISILTRFSSSKRVLRKWMKLYPNDENILIENTAELETFFKDFEDISPITEDEKKTAEELYDGLIGEEAEKSEEDGKWHCPKCYAYVYEFEHRCCECGTKIKFPKS
jgi:hypothetical protein